MTGRPKENMNFAFIEGLTENSKIVLESLLTWNYTIKKATSFNISIETNQGETSVSRILRYLKYRGIVLKSAGGAWFIVPVIKERLLVETSQKIENAPTMTK